MSSLAVCAALATITSASALVRAASVAQDGPDQPASEVPAGWSEDGRYAELFAPAPHRAEYRTFVTPRPLAEALRDLDAPGLLHAPGAWTPERLPPTDAFGAGGPYNPVALRLVYGGEAPQVARGPRAAPGGVLESWTLVSPYPDRTLRHLERGTLLIVHRVAPL